MPTDLSSLTKLSSHLTAPWLEHHALLPLAVSAGRVRVATWRDAPELDEGALDDLALLLDADVELVKVPEADARRAIRRVYGDQGTAQGVIAAIGAAGAPRASEGQAIDDLLALANEAPVVKLVNLLLVEALGARASDVHLEAYADELRVRYRVDGVLQDAPSPPPQLAAAVVSRLKIMADLDVAERRVPQDGRIRLRLQDRTVDVRVSTVPTLHGESVVLRLLDKERGRISLEQLGMAPDTLERFRAVLARPHGVVLATGPTGSGKTTTLYAAVELLRTGREKILTVEDPVEYELAGVAQVPVNEKVGVTFATALRALLRQDPDVMLVGEIRDPETAEIATQAALTGHLVLSTLHTNDAPSALTRLRELGVAPYLVSSTVEAVLAQRLVRVRCTECGGAGCPSCRATGYRGRVGIYELLVMSDALRAAVVRGADTAELRRLALAEGMRTLAADGQRLVATGATSAEEVARATGATVG